MDYKIFIQKSVNQIDYDFVNKVSKEFDISYLSSMILNIKGFTKLDDIEVFLDPNEGDLLNPFLFNDMERIVERVLQSIKTKEKIIFFCDYDCDGVTSSIILYKTIKVLGGNCKIIIPNRFTNGYGLNDETLEKIMDEEPGLVITADNGITSVEEVELLLCNDMDVIVTDHHTPPEILPDAFGILNPKVEGENYPFKDLCGAGVSLKLAYALIEKSGKKFNTDELLVFAMLGTIADLVPLKGENRTIASLGLNLIKNTKNKGLLELIKKSELKLSNLNSGNISFQIAPRVNAAGRLADASDAVNLFLSEDDEEIEKYSSKLCLYNDTRKGIEDDIFNRSEEYIEKNKLNEQQNILFVLDEDFHEGVMGIAASKLTEKYNKPVIVMTKSESGLIKASCRSITGFNIIECLNSCNDLFDQSGTNCGGHAAAAGFSIEHRLLKELVVRTNLYAVDHGISNLLYRRQYYDSVAIPSDLNMKTVREFDKFAPFGIGNSKPVLALKNVRLSNVRAIGADGKHLKFSVLSNGNYYDAIAFSKGYFLNEYDFTKNFDIVFTISINSYMGNEKLQFEIKDIDYHSIGLKSFHQAYYKYFINTLEEREYFYPKENEVKMTVEGAIESYSDKVLIVYGEDTYLRVIKYLNMTNKSYKISFNELEKQENSINVLVFPTKIIDEDEVVILDRPEFNDYNKDLYENIKVNFIKKLIPIRSVQITREFFVYLYKKFKIIQTTGSNINDFILNIKNDSDVDVNYFTVRVALDIMVEMNILNYSIKNDKLNLSFNKIQGKKNINETKIMKKLNGIGD